MFEPMREVEITVHGLIERVSVADTHGHTYEGEQVRPGVWRFRVPKSVDRVAPQIVVYQEPK